MAREPFLINPMELDPYSGKFESSPMSYEYGDIGGRMKKRKKSKKSKKIYIGKKRRQMSMHRLLLKQDRLRKFVAKPVRKKKLSKAKKATLRSKAKRSIREGSKHHILALQRRGHLFTSPRARLVRKGLRLNPFSESLMLVGSNPKRRKGGKSMARRMKRNPLALVKQVTDMAQPIGVGILAMSLPERIANFVDGTPGSYMNLGAKLGVVIGGNFAVKAFAGSRNAEVWLMFGLAKIAKELVDRYVFNPLMSMVAPTAPLISGTAGISAPIFPNSRALSGSIEAPVRPLRNFKGNLYNINV